MPQFQGIKVTDGNVLLNEFPYSTLDYHPPQYPRSISYEDTAVASGDNVVNRRSVTDLGPLRGVWKPFTLLCYNNDYYDGVVQPGRGQYMLDTLMHLFNDFIGEPIILTDRVTDNTYNVMFTQDGLNIKYANREHFDTDTQDDYGPEYEVQVALIEVETS